MKNAEILSLTDVRACLPEGLQAATTSTGWLSILNPDGTHVASVAAEDWMLHFDVELFSTPRDEMSADRVDELQGELELVLEELVLPGWREAGFRLDTVEECATAGSGWWHIVARMEADFTDAADLRRKLGFAVSNVGAVRSTIGGTGVAEWWL